MKKVPRFFATIYSLIGSRTIVSPAFRDVDMLRHYLSKVLNKNNFADISVFYPRRAPIVMLEDVLHNEIDRVRTLKHCEEVKV